MRKCAVCLFSILLHSVCSFATTQEPPPQTARQALMEMFFSKETGTFNRHLPDVTLAALEKSGALDKLKLYSAVTQIPNQGRFKTFETGPILLSVDDPKTNLKLDVVAIKTISTSLFMPIKTASYSTPCRTCHAQLFR